MRAFSVLLALTCGQLIYGTSFSSSAPYINAKLIWQDNRLQTHVTDVGGRQHLFEVRTLDPLSTVVQGFGDAVSVKEKSDIKLILAGKAIVLKDAKINGRLSSDPSKLGIQSGTIGLDFLQNYIVVFDLYEDRMLLFPLKTKHTDIYRFLNLSLDRQYSLNRVESSWFLSDFFGPGRKCLISSSTSISMRDIRDVNVDLIAAISNVESPLKFGLHFVGGNDQPYTTLSRLHEPSLSERFDVLSLFQLDFSTTILDLKANTFKVMNESKERRLCHWFKRLTRLPFRYRDGAFYLSMKTSDSQDKVDVEIKKFEGVPMIQLLKEMDEDPMKFRKWFASTCIPTSRGFVLTAVRNGVEVEVTLK